MINNNVLIKLVRSRGIIDWPSKVNYIRLHLPELLKGFPGIGLGHVSLVEYQDLLPADIFILDSSLFSPAEDLNIAAVMIKEGSVIGIGRGITKHNLGDKLDEIINPHQFVLRVDCRPKENIGGAGYYYFYKSTRNYSNEKK